MQYEIGKNRNLSKSRTLVEVLGSLGINKIRYVGPLLF